MSKVMLLLLFIFVLSFSLFGCSNNEPEPQEEDIEKVEEEDPGKKDPEEEEPEDEQPKETVPGSLYIRYIFNNGKGDALDKVTSIEEYSFLEPKWEGHEFFGWYKDEDLYFELKLSDLVMPTDENDIIINAYADWSVAHYLVKFMCDDVVIISRVVSYGEAAREPVASFKPGYRFVGWDKDVSCVKEDMVVNAVYTKNDATKNIMVILGNWMNNDGTISATMRARLELALKAYSEFSFDYIVVTGGMANSAAGISEAEAMYNYLVNHGIDRSIIIKEDQSMSTQQNATYTMKKLEDIDFKNLVIVSTIEHFVNYQTIKFFNDAAKSNSKIYSKNINIMIYTNNGTY